MCRDEHTQTNCSDAQMHTHIQNYRHPTGHPTTGDASKFCSQNCETWPETLVNTTQLLLFHISAQEKLTQENSYWEDSSSFDANVYGHVWALIGMSLCVYMAFRSCLGPWIHHSVIIPDFNAENSCDSWKLNFYLWSASQTQSYCD